MINFDDFKKLDMRVGTIKSAEEVEGADKLLKLQVDLGEEIGERQIVAGIKKSHDPAELEGRQIVVLVNLEPRKLMGLESQGMLLAAGDDEPVLLQPEREAKEGSKIR
ncbi:MAG: methionine--tRNA ligase subunit beta [Candidatus Spechtbacterales bacterium]|nr:methionine--tRNA ligase subunit beta [Candidatus Spechtbacterales bacterium]